MKVLESALYLVAGTALLTFTGICFIISRHPLTLSNPGLFVEALGLSGAVLICLGARSLYALHQALQGNQRQALVRSTAT